MNEKSVEELRAQLERARDEGLALVEGAHDLRSLDEVEIRVRGRKAPLSTARSALGSVPDEHRKTVGRLANEVQEQLEGAITSKRERLRAAEREKKWETEQIDVTLPGLAPPVGALHPLTRTIWEIVDIFIGMGYRVADGPEIELSRYNFDALNTPMEHPSRSPTDTYFTAGSNAGVCLRTHTSPVQARVMESQQPPVYVVVPGRTYRRDVVDATHSNVFVQIEGLAVDEGITMGDLKGSLQVFARAVFGKNLEVRFRPHFFPFTEPSAEMDVQCFSCRGSDPACRVCKGEGWVEILGCGIVHPAVFEWVGYDTERYTGFAFGMGVERIAMLAHGGSDLRYFWDNDLRLLTQFEGVA